MSTTAPHSTGRQSGGQAVLSRSDDASGPLGSTILRRLDDACERFGDAVNPILVKETRQALKSRQFVVTFSVILLAALGWTVVGSLSLMPQIYTSPSAPRMMIGYYVVLALPMLMVVPLAAYRSLESEIDDGTLELLSITALSPWQIVLGKLAGASLQMLLYFVTLFPCLAYAYSLRGVDLPTTMSLVVSLAALGMFLTVAGLFFAPLARGRTGRILSLLALIFLLVLAEYGLGALVINMIWQGNPLSGRELLFALLGSTATLAALGHLLLTATAALLTPETENRSTGIRLSLLVLTAVMVVTISLSLLILAELALTVYAFGLLLLAILWIFCGALMVGERSTITPRIRRELPNSFVGRALLTWLTPGPSTGLVFAILGIAVLLLMQQASLRWVLQSGRATGVNASELRRFFGQPAVLLAAYTICGLVLVRPIMFIVRLKNDPRVEVGLAGFVVVALMASLVPYSVQLHYNDYQPLDYDPTWQVTNWVFTVGVAVQQGVPPSVVQNVTAAAAGLGLLVWRLRCR